MPFLLSPVELPLPTEPIVGAESLHRTIKPWADQAMNGSTSPASDEPHALTTG